MDPLWVIVWLLSMIVGFGIGYFLIFPALDLWLHNRRK